MSTQQAASVKLRELAEAGVKVDPVWGDDYHLTVDLDTPEAIKAFPQLLKALKERRAVEIEGEWKSRSGKGYHYYLKLGQRTGFQERAALQAMLGSDPLREMLGFFDINNCSEEDPFVLFKPAPVAAIPKPVNEETCPF